MATFGEAPEAAACMDTIMSIGDAQHTAIQSATGKIFADHGVEVTQLREFGHPVDTIVNAAETIHADLIVLGSRGMNGFKALLLGSISDGVLHHAHCPTLVIR
jgi:nucleotide-binding universal stress UspA family protein